MDEVVEGANGGVMRAAEGGTSYLTNVGIVLLIGGYESAISTLRFASA